MSRTAVAIRHVAFENLGNFERPLRHAGYRTHYHDVGLDGLERLRIEEPDLLIVLGGPIGAYEEDKYPFLKDEIALIERRIKSVQPTIGICLGAQVMARALGARVYPGSAKEIGFAPLRLTDVGRASCVNAFAAHEVLHWHGDVFDLPTGGECLASTDVCPVQAFAYGARAIGFQFHPEAGEAGFEQWLIGHTLEIAAAGLDVSTLRQDYGRLAPGLAQRGASCLDIWLRGIAQQ
jgi:GMP synthase (glutamine-hydrolysing)